MNVCWNVPPAPSVPLSQTLASLVVVCADGPLLVHVTVVPTFTLMVDGEKTKSRIDTVVPPVMPPPVGVLLLGLVGELLQAARVATATKPPMNALERRITRPPSPPYLRRRDRCDRTDAVRLCACLPFSGRRVAVG